MKISFLQILKHINCLYRNVYYTYKDCDSSEVECCIHELNFINLFVNNCHVEKVRIEKNAEVKLSFSDNFERFQKRFITNPICLSYFVQKIYDINLLKENQTVIAYTLLFHNSINSSDRKKLIEYFELQSPKHVNFREIFINRNENGMIIFLPAIKVNESHLHFIRKRRSPDDSNKIIVDILMIDYNSVIGLNQQSSDGIATDLADIDQLFSILTLELLPTDGFDKDINCMMTKYQLMNVENKKISILEILKPDFEIFVPVENVEIEFLFNSLLVSIAETDVVGILIDNVRKISSNDYKIKNIYEIQKILLAIYKIKLAKIETHNDLKITDARPLCLLVLKKGLYEITNSVVFVNRILSKVIIIIIITTVVLLSNFLLLLFFVHISNKDDDKKLTTSFETEDEMTAESSEDSSVEESMSETESNQSCEMKSSD